MKRSLRQSQASSRSKKQQHKNEQEHLLIRQNNTGCEFSRKYSFWKLQIPGLSYNWRGFQAWDTLEDSTDDSSIGKAETSLEWQEHFSQFQDTTNALPCHTHLLVCLWIMDPHSKSSKKNTSHGHEMLPQDTTHIIQRPCYQRGIPCQDPAGNWTTRRPSFRRKETQTAAVWTCLPFIWSGLNHLPRHDERGRRQGRQKKRWEELLF